MSSFQRGQQIIEGRDRGTARLLQAFDPGVECGRLLDLQRLVGAVSGINAGLELAPANRAMMLQRIGGIVRGAERADLMALQQIMHAQPRKLRIGFAPDAVRAFGIQELVDSEIACELQMRPVIERIAQGVGNRCSPRLEFFLRRRIARDASLGNSIRPHRAPLVVIARQPKLGQIRELVVGRDLRRREMIVIIDDGLGRRVTMIKLAGLLIETEPKGARLAFAVVGIGINVGHAADDFSPEVRELATSLFLLTGRTPRRADLLVALLQAFERRLARPFAEAREAWASSSLTLGQRVTLTTARGVKRGQALGLDESGALLLRNDAGEIEAVTEGDLRVEGKR